jgi:hypothetical protein
VLLGILQTPHRFRTKRQLWTYSGLGIEVYSSADHHVVKGQLERKKKHIEIRGLNENCNHDLKNLFKGAAVGPRLSPVRSNSSTRLGWPRARGRKWRG